MTTVADRISQATLADDGRPREPRRRSDPSKDRREIDLIVERVQQREKALQPLWDRMDNDLLRYELDPFTPIPGDGIAPEDAYTSNEPRVLADDIIALVGSAPALVRVESETEEGFQNDIDQNAERVAIGMIRLGNESRERTAQTLFQQTLAFNAVVRGGWVACRNLLTKRKDGSTKVHLDPIDPRQLVFQMGPDGLKWAAIITMRSRGAIRDEYDFEFTDTETATDDADQLEKVIDYYRKVKDEWMNSVIISGESRYAKEPANTFAVMDPVTIRAIGSNPGVASFSLTQGAEGGRSAPGIEGFGESIYGPNRAVYDSDNRIKSILTSNLAKQNSGVYKTTSSGGEFTLEEEPQKAGQVNLNSDLNEDVVLLDLPAIHQNAMGNLSFIESDRIGGGAPPSSRGIASGSQSGRALTILNSVMGKRANPFATAVQSCMLGAVEALMAQYETDRYETLHVTGKRLDNEGFSREIPAQEIKGHGPLSVTLVPELPEDQEAKWLMAASARQIDPSTGRPVVSDQYILEDILEIQDAKLERFRVDVQMARTATPKRLLETQLESAIYAGDQDLIMALVEELRRLSEQQFMEDMARRFAFMQAVGQDPLQAAAQGMGGPGGGAGGPQQGGSVPLAQNGQDPRINPLSGTAFGRSPGANDATANAGVERPGAQNGGIPGLELSLGDG